MINKHRLLFFPCILLLLLIMIGWDNRQLLNSSQETLLHTYTSSFLQGNIGSGYGSAEPQDNPWASLEPGDIILGGWPNCAYGQYSHAGLYIGDDQVLESYVDYGVCIQPLEHYNEYTELCLLRVEASRTLKEKVVNNARKYEGELFYPLAFKAGQRYWNCSKIIWKLYADQGVDLDVKQDLWIAPASFRDAPKIIIIFERGAP